MDEPDLPAKSEEEDDGYDESPKSTMLPIICATLSSTFGSTRVGIITC
jgi:hypothetical protein